MKHFYRLVYWKRRLLGTGAGGVRRTSAPRRRRAVRIPEGGRAPLVFAAMVGVVLALSALFGYLGGAYGRPHGGPDGGTESDRRYAHEVEQGWNDLPPECREAFGSKAAYAEFHERVVEHGSPRTGVSFSCGDGS